MKPIPLTMTVDADALLDLLTQAIEKGTTRCTQAVGKWKEPQATVEKAVPVSVAAIKEPQAQSFTVQRLASSEKLFDAKAE